MTSSAAERRRSLPPKPPARRIVPALIRRQGELLLVRQQGPRDPVARLRRLPLPVMREPLIAYLEQRLPSGAVWHYRQEKGRQLRLSAETGGRTAEGKVP